MGHFGNLGGNRPGCRANDRSRERNGNVVRRSEVGGREYDAAAHRLKRTAHRAPLLVEQRSISSCLEAAAPGSHDDNRRHECYLATMWSSGSACLAGSKKGGQDDKDNRGFSLAACTISCWSRSAASGSPRSSARLLACSMQHARGKRRATDRPEHAIRPRHQGRSAG